ncbi:hypothetical protein ABZU92_18265 [Micromonospora arida]|uniref:hypothetical protein n=1 Tax=Micromonospora arida TaxID=2203715 RepID=UPI0033A003BA
MRKATITLTALTAAATLALLAGCDQDDDTSLSGEPCEQPGQVIDENGRRLTCTTTLVDGRPRWRTGQLDLPTR